MAHFCTTRHTRSCSYPSHHLAFELTLDEYLTNHLSDDETCKVLPCLDVYAGLHSKNQVITLDQRILALALTPIPPERTYLALGLEGSANKLGAGIIKHDTDGSMTVLSNVRHTYITPPGEGFLPRDTAQHHRQWALKVIGEAVENAGVSMHDLDCICFTKGEPVLNPGTGIVRH